MTVNGADQTRLTTNPANDVTPYWSPDGRRIVFSSTRDGNPELYVMNVDGSNPTRLADTPSAEVLPSWSPDGARIAFQSNRDGNFEIYVMNADGSGQRRLTHNPGNDISYSWSPDGSRIAFLWGAESAPEAVGQHRSVECRPRVNDPARAVQSGHSWGAWHPHNRDRSCCT